MLFNRSITLHLEWADSGDPDILKHFMAWMYLSNGSVAAGLD